MDLAAWILASASVLAALAGPIAAGHALLTKQEPQVATAWITVCLLFPLAGALFYYTFGINRVRTRARKLRAEGQTAPGPAPSAEAHTPAIGPEYTEQVRISGAVTGRSLQHGNRIETLRGGEQAFPSMLEAIDTAQHSVYLSTYIFGTKSSGRQFIRALTAAHRRGVDVRVLIDGVGDLYAWPRASRLLRRAGVPTARFLPPRLVPPQLSINLRNHRKLLIVDGQRGFTGGMNLSERLLLGGDHAHRVADTHFLIDGPVVAQMEQVFLEDWAFTTGEPQGPSAPGQPHDGGALCRIITDGPNEDLDRLMMTLIGALSAAREEVWLVTPYFLPMRSLMTALEAAALRGVEVNVLLPGRNNLPFVHWATRHMLGELIHWGVQVYYQPPPFAHSKLFVVDRRYAQVGSSNMDPRSLRLNFELNAEVYDPVFAGEIATDCQRLRDRSRQVSRSELAQRPPAERLRDAVCWLASPYL
ncbi:MAG: phospholipase D-like domain-containing protein [Halorhodospira sp.]